MTPQPKSFAMPFGDSAQALALAFVVDAAGNAHIADRGQKHGQTPGQRDVAGEARPLVAARFLDDLHHHRLPRTDKALDARPAQLFGKLARRRCCMSPAYRKAFLSRPMLTKAAFMPGRTFSTRPT